MAGTDLAASASLLMLLAVRIGVLRAPATDILAERSGPDRPDMPESSPALPLASVGAGLESKPGSSRRKMLLPSSGVLRMAAILIDAARRGADRPGPRSSTVISP